MSCLLFWRSRRLPSSPGLYTSDQIWESLLLCYREDQTVSQQHLKLFHNRVLKARSMGDLGECWCGGTEPSPPPKRTPWDELEWWGRAFISAWPHQRSPESMVKYPHEHTHTHTHYLCIGKRPNTFVPVQWWNKTFPHKTLFMYLGFYTWSRNILNIDV